MPTLVTFIAAGLGTFLSAATALLVAKIIVVGLVIGAIALPYLLKPGGAPSFRQAAQKRTQMVREPITTRKIIYGEIKASGQIILWESTNNNKFHHLVVALCDQESNRIGTVFFDETPIYEDQLDGSGNVISGRFSGKARIKKHLGDPDEVADPDLVAEVDKWTSEHRGREVTYLYTRIELDRDVFPNGVPTTISAVIQGQLIFDSRTSVTRWTPNSSLCIRSYLLNPRYGRKNLAVVGLDTPSFNAEANTSEEFVASGILNHDVTSVNTANDELTLDGTSLKYRFKNRVRLTTTVTLPSPLAIDTDYYVIVTSVVGRVIRLATSKQNANDNIFIDITDTGTGVHTVTFERLHLVETVITATDVLELDREKLVVQMGDKVQLTTTGTLPAGLSLATDYFVITHHEQEVLDDDDVVLERCAVKLAVNYLNALDRIAIDITGTGTGVHTLIKKGEPRYTCNGMVDSGSEPHSILSDMLTSLAGTITKIGGIWEILAGVYRSPGISLSEKDLVGSISTPTRISMRGRFNRIRGTYVDPQNDWQPSDYPPVTKSQFQVDDDNKINDKTDFDLPFTSRSATGQRLALIALRRSRQEISVDAQFGPRAYQQKTGDTEKLSNAVRSWTDKIFEVVESTPGFSTDDKDIPIFVVSQVLREIAPSVFDFDPDVDEVIIDDAPNTDLGNPRAGDPPTNLVITEENYITRDGVGVKTRAIVTFTASVDIFVLNYQVEHKLSSDSVWIISPLTQGLVLHIDDIEPNTFDFRVLGITRLGSQSAYVTKLNQQIVGLLAPPTEPQNLTLSIVGGSAYLRWDKSQDIDVRIGGEFIVRHSEDLVTAVWTESVTIGPAIGGNEVQAVLPLKSGTYLMKAKDASNPPIFSLGTASVSTKQASVSSFTTTDTLTEDPNFTGAKVNTEVVTNILKLTSSGGDVDPTGTYTFSGGFDFGAVLSRRITTALKAIVTNVDDLVDDFGLIDDRLDWDGTSQAESDAVIFMRQTDDDPTGSPTWGPWERLESGEVEAWGVELRATLTTSNSSFNIEISELSAKAESID